MSTTPDRPARTPGSLLEAGLAHLDEAVRLAGQASPNFTKATMMATLATAHITAAQVGFQIAHSRREVNGPGAPTMLSDLRHSAAMNGWAETTDGSTLIFTRTPEDEAASPWRLEVILQGDLIASVTLNGMVIGNSQVYHALRLYGAHRHDDGQPAGSVVAWPPSPTQRPGS